MIANGNSFGLSGSSAGGNCSLPGPESTEHLGDLLTWGWTGFQSVGNAL